MYIRDVSQPRTPYIKSAVLASALVIIPVAITIILGIAAFYGHLGSSAQNLITHKILPYILDFTGYIPNISLVAMGSAGGVALIFYTIFSFSLGCFKNNTAISTETSPATSECIADLTTYLPSLKPKDIEQMVPSPLLHSKSNESTDITEALAPPKKKLHLPEFTYAENGSLSDRHFLYYILNSDLSDEERDAAIVWSFSQRKFIATGNSFDRYAHIEGRCMINDSENLCILEKINYKNRMPLWTDRQGHAIATTDYDNPHLKHFISAQNHSIQIINCTDYEFIKNKTAILLVVGKYEDGKHILQQTGTETSAQTCQAMLALDRGQAVNFENLILCVSKEDKTEAITLRHTSQLHAAIEKHGPILAQVQDNAIGRHTFIIDGVNRGIMGYWATVTIRDPFHGWRITIPHWVFKRMNPHFRYMKYESN